MGTLIDDYDYVMHGKIFKYQLDEEQRNITIYVSFGGLLMSIKGEVKTLKALQIDSRIYLLMKEQWERNSSLACHDGQNIYILLIINQF